MVAHALFNQGRIDFENAGEKFKILIEQRMRPWISFPPFHTSKQLQLKSTCAVAILYSWDVDPGKNSVRRFLSLLYFNGLLKFCDGILKLRDGYKSNGLIVETMFNLKQLLYFPDSQTIQDWQTAAIFNIESQKITVFWIFET